MIVAVAQIGTHASDLEDVSQRMLELSQRASAEGAELLVMPAMVLEGLCGSDPAGLGGFRHDVASMLNALSRSIPCPCLVPLATSENAATPPEVALVQRGGIAWLKSASYETEASGFDVTAFEYEGSRFAVVFDWDDMDSLRELDAHVVLFLARQGFAFDDPRSALGASVLEGGLCDDARAIGAWVIGVGSLGCYDLRIHPGSSFAVSPEGELARLAPSFEESLMVVDLDLSSDRDEGRVSKIAPYNAVSFLWETLVLGLRDYVGKVNATDVALVLDGHVSSSVLAALATDAMGPTHVLPVVAFGASESRRRAARQLAESLHLGLCECAELATPVVSGQEALADATEACLAALVRKSGAVALSSGDKTFYALEARLGRCNVSQVAPLGDVYRCDVVRLAQMRNTISPVIEPELVSAYDVPGIEGVSEVLPTSEARLEFVDSVLASHIERGMTATEIAATGVDANLCLRVLNLMSCGQVARATLPPCLAVSSRCLHEIGNPMGAMWLDRIRDDESIPPDFSASADSGTPPLATEDVPSGLSEDELAGLMGQIEEEMTRRIPDAMMGGDIDRQVSELLEFIRDVVQGGGNAINEGMGGVSLGMTSWDNPFSEN